MLSAIVAVTLIVPDVGAVEQAYQRALAYETVERGQVSAGQAVCWGAGRLAGRDYVVLRPESREPVYVRLVESGTAAAPAPMQALGWNATEILVEDPAGLARKLDPPAFKVIGSPAPLDFNPAVVAMQVLGPAGELLYFTRMPAGKSKFGLGSATSFVDRVFIVVLGVHDVRRSLAFYATTFGLEVTEPVPTRVDILADAWTLPREQTFLLGIARLPARFLIEVDEYPSPAGPKPAPAGELPPGMAMVSFTVPSLDPFRSQLVAPPASPDGLPYAGRRTGVMLGPSGEHIELIEAGGAAPGAASGGRQ